MEKPGFNTVVTGTGDFNHLISPATSLGKKGNINTSANNPVGIPSTDSGDITENPISSL